MEKREVDNNENKGKQTIINKRINKYRIMKKGNSQ